MWQRNVYSNYLPFIILGSSSVKFLSSHVEDVLKPAVAMLIDEMQCYKIDGLRFAFETLIFEKCKKCASCLCLDLVRRCVVNKRVNEEKRSKKNIYKFSLNHIHTYSRKFYELISMLLIWTVRKLNSQHLK